MCGKQAEKPGQAPTPTITDPGRTYLLPAPLPTPLLVTAVFLQLQISPFGHFFPLDVTMVEAISAEIHSTLIAPVYQQHASVTAVTEPVDLGGIIVFDELEQVFWAFPALLCRLFCSAVCSWGETYERKA